MTTHPLKALPQRAPADWMNFLTGEMLAASLLSRTLYNPPTLEWLQALSSEDIFADAPLGDAQPDVQAGLALLQGWAQTGREGITTAALDDIRVDYTRLFTGPDRVLAPPWESVYFTEERLVFNTQTSQVRAWYLRFQLEVEKQFQEPDDHIGLELAFVAHLARLALLALDQGNQASFDEIMTAQREFLSNHLLNWAADFCHLVSMEARTDFYRGIALLTRGSLAEIAAELLLPVAESAR